MAEHGRKSLVNESQSSGARSKAKAGSKKNGIKLAIVGVCFAAACVLLAYNFGLIESPFAEKPKPAVLTPEDNKVRDDFQKRNEAEAKKPNPPVLGGS